MTPEERYKEARACCGHGAEEMDVCDGCFVEAIRVAVEEEREACAKVVEDYDPDEVWLYTDDDGSYSETESADAAKPKIAAAIRARKES